MIEKYYLDFYPAPPVSRWRIRSKDSKLPLSKSEKTNLIIIRIWVNFSRDIQSHYMFQFVPKVQDFSTLIFQIFLISGIRHVLPGSTPEQVSSYLRLKCKARAMLWQHPRLQVIVGLHLLRCQPKFYCGHCRIWRRWGFPSPTIIKNRKGGTRCTRCWRSQRPCSRCCLVSSQWSRDSLGLGGLLRQGLADPRRGLDENDDRPNRRSAQAPEEGWNCALAPFCSGEILDAKRSRQISQML